MSPPRSISPAQRSAAGRAVRPSRRSRQRTKGRGRQRGVAMVEALVVMLTLILLHICVIYINDVRQARHEAMRASRKAVWAHSLKACRSGEAESGGHDPSLLMVTGDLTDALQIAKGRTLMKPLVPDLTTAVSTKSATARSQDTERGALPSVTATTKSTVLCNEKQDSISTMDIRGTIHTQYGDFL